MEGRLAELETAALAGRLRTPPGLPDSMEQALQAYIPVALPADEVKRLDAYAFFDPDIEQYLIPRRPPW
jgi:hypothetical protein